jgi:cytochrome P450
MAYLTPKNILEYFVFVNASVMKRTKEEEKLQGSASDEISNRKDMFHYLFNTKTPDTGLPAFSAEELTAEANLLLIAGTDTTANALSALWFYLTRNDRVYRKLAAEIRTAFESVDDIKGGAKLSSCQYLRACIDEALRMAPTGIVSEMSREVLPGGLDIDGSVFPEGVKIGTSSWAVMYHEQYFGDPYVYRPERWIVDEKNSVTADDVALSRSAFNPFSVGAGNCVGQKLAMLELQVVTARVLYRMDVQCSPGDNLGGGSPELGWGRRDKNQFQLEDAFVSLVNGPMVQFRKRVV